MARMDDRYAGHDALRGDCSSSSEDDMDAPSPAAAQSTSAATNAASALLISASDKAGMKGIDRERINAILLRESGNSTFMQRQKKMDEKTNRRIEEMRRRIEEKDGASSTNWRRELEQETIEPLLRSYRGQRRPLSTCVVIDMDGFFINCHTLDHPHLAEIPACVGGKSMISTSNYVARKYGVRAAMPGYLGSMLVNELSGGKEELTFVKSDFGLYKKKSSETRAVLEEYDQHLKMYSLDEAYMDIGPYLEVKLSQKEGELSHEDIMQILRNKSHSYEGIGPLHERLPISTIHAAAQALLHSIRQRVKDATGLTCSAGLCSNFLLAKIASDFNKPNGQHFVGPSEEEILEFISPLPIRKVNGIGRVMEKTLRGACGVETVRDLYQKRAEVHFLFKPATANFLMRASIGHKEGLNRESAEDEDGDNDEALSRKGISHERTFTPTSSWSGMCTKLEGIALMLARDVRERNLRPKTITLKVKQSNFEIISRAKTRDLALFQSCNQSTSAQDLVDVAINLLKEAKREADMSEKSTKGSAFSVRLLGVRCSNFQLDNDNQSSLDRYRIGRSLDNSPKRPALPQSTSTRSSQNPYLSPKSASPNRGNGPRDTLKSGAATTKRALCGSPADDKPNCSGMQTDASETGDDRSHIECPLCGRHFQTSKHDNAEVNAHIDACLNASTVKQLAKEETKCADQRIKTKKRRLTDFFGS